MRRLALIASLLLPLPAAFVLIPSRAAGDDDIQPVSVTNFPETQKVEGRVSIEGPLRQAALAAVRDIEVPPVGAGDPRRMVSAGVLTADGFAAVVLSLSGSAKGMPRQAGEVGVVLVPDEEPIQGVLEERGRALFPLDARADVGVGDPIFSSRPQRTMVAFPRYRILLYNTSDRTVLVDLFAYLTM